MIKKIDDYNIHSANLLHLIINSATGHLKKVTKNT